MASEPLLARMILAEFREMPDLILTADQAARLWALPIARCVTALEALVDDGWLRRIEGGRYIRGSLPSGVTGASRTPT
ncbi:MAG: hypothetical protein AB7G23_01065 [Vicinamibacterales bacterium]